MKSTKSPKPFNIWVYRRSDGITTLGEYIRAKRHVFWSGKSIDESLCGKLNWHFTRNQRPFSFQGDPLPSGWIEQLKKRLPPQALA